MTHRNFIHSVWMKMCLKNWQILDSLIFMESFVIGVPSAGFHNILSIKILSWFKFITKRLMALFFELGSVLQIYQVVCRFSKACVINFCCCYSYWGWLNGLSLVLNLHSNLQRLDCDFLSNKYLQCLFNKLHSQIALLIVVIIVM